jgi:hypothetical protein
VIVWELEKLIRDYTMQEEFKIAGYWRPAAWDSDREIRGFVEYSPRDGINLVLEGTFEEPLQPGKPLVLRADAFVHYEVIHGRALDNDTPITLFEAIGPPIPNFGNVSQRYRCQWCIVGEHVRCLAEWKHTSVWVRHYNLEEFIGSNPFSLGSPEPRERRLTATFVEPLAMKGLLGKYEVQTAHEANLSTEPMFTRVELTHAAWLRISAPIAMGADFLRGPLHMIGCLLDLAAGQHLPIIALHGLRGAQRSQIFFNQKRAHFLPKRLQAIGGHPIGFAFTLRHLASKLTASLSAWYWAMTFHAASFNLYFTLDPEQDADVATDFHFISYATALEAYHEVAHRTCQRCEAIRQQRSGWRQSVLLTIGSSAEKSISDWVSGVLGAASQPSLKTRYYELFDEQPECVRKLLGQREAFVEFVYNCRNLLAHGGRPYDGPEELIKLWRATRKLRLLMQSIMLQQLALPAPLFLGMLQNLSDYRYLNTFPG